MTEIKVKIKATEYNNNPNYRKDIDFKYEVWINDGIKVQLIRCDRYEIEDKTLFLYINTKLLHVVMIEYDVLEGVN